MADILVVDDEIGIRELLNEILGDEGHTVLLAENAAQARQMRDDQDLDLVLLDIWMPDVDGVSLLKEWAAAGQLSMPVIMMSGHATIDTAVEATRIGALDFLEKPISLQKLLKTVENGLARRTISRGVPRPQPLPANGMPARPVPALGPRPEPSSGQGRAAPAGGPAHGASLEMPEAAGLYTGSIETSAQEAQSGFALGGERGADLSLSSLKGSGPDVGGLFSERTGMMTAVVATAGGGPGQARALLLDLPLRDARDAFERTYFEHHLAREQGSMTRVAEKTGLERTHLYRKLKQLGIDLSKGAFRKGGSGSGQP